MILGTKPIMGVHYYCYFTNGKVEAWTGYKTSQGAHMTVNFPGQTVLCQRGQPRVKRSEGKAMPFACVPLLLMLGVPDSAVASLVILPSIFVSLSAWTEG